MFAFLLSEWVEILPPSPKLLFMALPKQYKVFTGAPFTSFSMSHSSRCIIHKFIFIISPLSLGLFVFLFGYSLFVYLGQYSMTKHDEEQGGRLILMMSTKWFSLLAVVKPCNAKQWNKMLWSLMTSVSTTTKLNYQEPYCCCKSNKTKCILNTSRNPSPCNFTQRKFDYVLQTFTHISWDFRKLENMNVNIWPNCSLLLRDILRHVLFFKRTAEKQSEAGDCNHLTLVEWVHKLS